MKKAVFYFFGLFALVGCKDKEQPKEETVVKTEQPASFKMYQMSEMAALMEQMYVDNQRIKEKIENNEFDFGDFPEHYQKIHTATFPEPSDLDDFFTAGATYFVETQKKVYTDTTNAKEHFNNAVTACIECHKVKCTGPIERIKKLYIK